MKAVQPFAERLFQDRVGAGRLAYLVAPALCLVVPGPGVLLGAAWALLLLWRGRQKAAVTGLRAPRQLLALIGVAVVVAVVIMEVADHVVTPLAESVTGTTLDLDAIGDIEGNWPKFLLWLAAGWVSGGIIEEFLFRGFLINVGTRLFGAGMLWPLAFLSSAVFGLSHLYQGWAGVLATGMLSLLLAIVFIVSRRNLLLTMLTHGFIDAISLSLMFLGLSAAA